MMKQLMDQIIYSFMQMALGYDRSHLPFKKSRF